HIDNDGIAKWNQRLLSVRLGDVPLENRSRVIGYYSAAVDFPPETLMVDIIDGDDAKMFPSDKKGSVADEILALDWTLNEAIVTTIREAREERG
nr:hypothetical protein [Candidatus Eremiobacteraeota bacterium]